MHVSLESLAALVGGTLHGHGQITVSGAKPLATAGAEEITFLENDKYLREAEASQAAAFLCPPGIKLAGRNVIAVADPLMAFITIFQSFQARPVPPAAKIAPTASIHPTATLGEGASVQAFVSIGANTVLGKRCRLYPGVVIGANCKIGDEVTLFPHAVVYDNCTLGNRVTLHAHAVIGADGFGYRFQNGKHVKIPQMGGVIIEDDVEIGAGTTIDSGTFEPTRVGTGTKIDNQVQIGHNCNIGRHNLLVSQVGIGGSSSTGDYVVMAGQVGVADHIRIGDQAVIGAMAGVPQDIPAKARVLGVPARPEREAKVIALTLDKLPELRQDVKQIKKKLGLAG
jgi:UDP-3-O-[3-hydroxymyristoyl] glucosamine N-acyltransferase